MVTENIGDLVYKLHMSKDLASNKISDDKAILKIKIGHVYIVFYIIFLYDFLIDLFFSSNLRYHN